jgi:methionyl-tRNA formyltransferase
LLLQTIKKVEKGEVSGVEQSHFEDLKPAPKLNASNTFIDFNKSALDIYNLVRGLNPYPTAHFNLKNKKCKVYQTKVEICNHNEPVGSLISDHKTELKVACLDGYIQLLDIQFEGKKRMNIKDFLMGYKLVDY